MAITCLYEHNLIGKRAQDPDARNRPSKGRHNQVPVLCTKPLESDGWIMKGVQLHGLNISYRLFEEETDDVNIINQLK